ncbi:MAG: alpha/beta fold hydrolase [Alphaproteobacteria bacterium]
MTSNKGNLSGNSISNEKFYYEWGDKNNCEEIILAVHGYNDYGNSFEKPGLFLEKHNVCTLAFDLNGFGKNKNRGNWFNVNTQITDIESEIIKLKEKNPKKKIYLLGESMGGAIALSLISEKKSLPIDGIILIAPAIWNFTEKNPLKSFLMNFFSRIFPYFQVDGDSLIEVKATDNLEILRQLSKDPFFIHKPNLESLYGIIKLMDHSYKITRGYIVNPSYNTLILVPIKDQIVPRKPLIELLKESKVEINKSRKINLLVYKDSYHMMLRDINGDHISEKIKLWISKKNKSQKKYLFSDEYKKLENSEFHHMLEK